MKGHLFAFVTVAIACSLQAGLAAAERRQVFIAAKKVSFCLNMPGYASLQAQSIV